MRWMRVIGATAVFLMLAGIGVASADASVSVPHSGWFWGNPRPQGKLLASVEFAGSRGYAAGDFGTVLRTDDGGATWSGLSTGTSVNFRRVTLISPDSFVVAGGCAVRRSDNGGQSFARLPWTASDASCTSVVNAVNFPTSTVGYLLLANGNIFRTQDGGQSWSRRTAVPGTRAVDPSSTAAPDDIVFTDANTGYAAIRFGQIYRTTDGGSTWSAVAQAPFAVNGVTFASPTIGFAVGNQGELLRSTDGGASWQPFGDTGTNEDLAYIRCGSPSACIVTPIGGRDVLFTRDGGKTWKRVSPANEPVASSTFTSPTRVVAVGVNGTTIFSDNGGETFSSVGDVLTGDLTSLRASSNQVAYAFGAAGSLARTTDGGATWQEMDAATSDDVIDVSFPTPQTGYALDAVGELLRTTNSGQSWEILNTGARRNPFAVLAVGANRVLLAGPVGLRLSTNRGQSFIALHQNGVTAAGLFALERAGRNVVVASGGHAIVESTNAGRNFRALRLPDATALKRVRGRRGLHAGHSLVSVDFVSASVGYALDDVGRLWRTRNAGKRWSEITALGTETGYTVDFSDAKHGWIAIDSFGFDGSGYVLRTSNGGTTWEPQLIDASIVRDEGLAATGPSNGFALTSGNHLFATSSSGSHGDPSRIRISVRHTTIDKPGIVRVDGKLTPPDGGSDVVVSMRPNGSRGWLFAEFPVATNGTFTAFARVNRTSRFVAQWAGDGNHRGAGSSVLVVNVRHPAKGRSRRPSAKIAAKPSGL